MTCAVARCGSQLCPDQSRQEHNRELNDLPPLVEPVLMRELDSFLAGC